MPPIRILPRTVSSPVVSPTAPSTDAVHAVASRASVYLRSDIVSPVRLNQSAGGIDVAPLRRIFVAPRPFRLASKEPVNLHSFFRSLETNVPHATKIVPHLFARSLPADADSRALLTDWVRLRRTHTVLLSAGGCATDPQGALPTGSPFRSSTDVLLADVLRPPIVSSVFFVATPDAHPCTVERHRTMLVEKILASVSLGLRVGVLVAPTFHADHAIAFIEAVRAAAGSAAEVVVGVVAPTSYVNVRSIMTYVGASTPPVGELRRVAELSLRRYPATIPFAAAAAALNRSAFQFQPTSPPSDRAASLDTSSRLFTNASIVGDIVDGIGGLQPGDSLCAFLAHATPCDDCAFLAALVNSLPASEDGTESSAATAAAAASTAAHQSFEAPSDQHSSRKTSNTLSWKTPEPSANATARSRSHHRRACLLGAADDLTVRAQEVKAMATVHLPPTRARFLRDREIAAFDSQHPLFKGTTAPQTATKAPSAPRTFDHRSYAPSHPHHTDIAGVVWHDDD